MDDNTRALLDAVSRLLNNICDAGADRDEDGHVYSDVAQLTLAFAAFPDRYISPTYYVSPTYKEECEEALTGE